MKKLGITFTPMTDERLNKIKSAAPEYELVITDYDDHRLKECEIVFGSMDVKLVAESPKLRWLHIQWAGADYALGSEYGFPEGVVLTNSSGSYGVTISEYLLTVSLMLMRGMNEYVLQQQKRLWKRLGSEKSIYGSTVCVLGLGDIGENYARRCKALGANLVKAVVRTSRPNKPEFVDELYTIEALEKALYDADIVAVCLPGTAETAGLIDKKVLQSMKKGVVLLNVGRGKIIDTKALIEELDLGHIGAAGLDVTDPEPLPEDSPLWKMPNVMITPHVSGLNTLEVTNDLGVDKFVKYLEDYVAGRPFERVVDKVLGY
ncbi:MAG: D-2-hydroxyacid dehydrogenase [Oscillospiraceae bacterium]|nr:D-2-hydroxyacid dehydrogenase [Oscillospiraceae bacterium]